MGSNYALITINKRETIMTKETIKETYLDKVAAKLKIEWHSQAAHKLAVGIYFLDMLEIKDEKKREELLKKWHETPPSFGTNCSALGQALGRESGKAKIEKTFAGF
jgi:hypothetical protein